MKKVLTLLITIALVLSGGFVRADSSPVFRVSNLTANYYLDDDDLGVSSLSVEEVITLQFPSAGPTSSGFKRVLTTQYLNNRNDLKLTSVTASNGQSVPYKTSYDNAGNLVVNIGDPAIQLFGPQTYIIHYQARGVINFLNDRDQFYPNFNGRGWPVPFDSINGVVHISRQLSSQLISPPKCLIDKGNCKIDIRKKTNEVAYVISAANRLDAKQSLTAKFDFKAGTFKPYEPPNRLFKHGAYGLVALIALAVIIKLADFCRRAMLKRKARN